MLTQVKTNNMDNSAQVLVYDVFYLFYLF